MIQSISLYGVILCFKECVLRILTRGTRLWQTGMMEQLGMQIRSSINKRQVGNTTERDG